MGKHDPRLRGRRRSRYLPDEEKKVERFCLRCDRRFVAEGKFNRLCPKCQPDGDSSVFEGNFSLAIYCDTPGDGLRKLQKEQRKADRAAA